MDFGLLQGLESALTLENLMFILIGSLLGTAVGVLPGLGPSSTLAILLPITLFLPPTGAIIMLAGIYYGAMYGGSTTSILLNVPGEIASVPTTIDGYQMTRQGRGGQALAIAAIGSFIAGIFGALVISFIAEPLALFGLRFGPPEFFAIVLFALVAIISFSGAHLAKGLFAGLAGLLLATVGLDPMSGTGRLTFDQIGLLSGFDLVAVLVGLFGISEVLASVGAGTDRVFAGKLPKWWAMIPRGKELRSGLKASVRGTLIGYPFGLIPGMLPAITTFLSYDVEKRIAKEPDRFGKGAIEGVAGPESANNATAMAGFVPLLALGIPAGPSLAVMLGALMAHGVTPGPQLFTTNGPFVWTVIASMFLANAALLILNLPMVKMWAKVSQIPYRYLAPLIITVCVIGAFSVRNSMFDVFTAVAFGFIGLWMKRASIPAAPLVLGLLLGPIFEQAMRQSLAMSGGSPMVFFGSDIAVAMLGLTALSLIIPLFLRFRSRRVKRVLEAAEADGWD